MSGKKTYRFNIDPDLVMRAAVEWTLHVFVQYTQANIKSDGVEWTVGYADSADIKLSKEFWRSIEDKDYSSKRFNSELKEITGDKLGTAFYFINCLWERDTNRKTDDWGRSEFTGSIWEEFGFKRPFCLVNNLFDELAQSLNIPVPEEKTEVFLSHDIDAVNSAWLEDGKAALKKGRVLTFLKEMKNQITGNPAWFNFKEIVELEKEYGASSTFFWIPTEKAIPGIGKNADYQVKSLKMRTEFEELSRMGAVHGIHKSIDDTSFKEEVDQLGLDVIVNRYHYLKFSFENLISELNASDLKMDASLGYAEVYGFRNGYSLPFIPFDIANNCASSFVEVPLTIMDATFSRYHKMDGEKAAEEILSFMKAHEKNALLSVLWHNTHYTDLKYEGYPAVYERILRYIQEKDMVTVLPSDIVNKYLNNVHK